MSKEHIWPKWLRRFIAFDDETYRSMTVTVNQDSRDEFEKRHGGDLRQRAIRCVCKSCNSGWMSTLQTRVKQTVISLINGDAISLSEEQQSTLAAWIATSVMASEYRDKTRVAISADDRHWTFNTKHAPVHWGIWIGRHPASAAWKPRLIHHVMEIAKDGVHVESGTLHRHNTQSTSYKVGDVFIHAMSCGPFPDLVRDFCPEIWFPGKILRVWPLQDTIAWPPRFDLSDTEAHAVSVRFFEMTRLINDKTR